MRMPSNIAAWFQGNLYLLTLSGYSADLFTCAKPGELNGDARFRWQFAVDMVYRGIKCGLMDVWDGANKARGTMDYSLTLVEDLARFDPDSDYFAMCWVGPEIEASELCHALIEKFDIQNFELGEICVPFIDEVEIIFERNGVSWSEAPLIELGSGAGAES
ncbi:hypothetical protein [Xylophilus ampelinus]|uniref:hypothetical protein n=1 Tax=Xylophilus ampelinus TaxID=54067 RepID=UPI0011B506C4|nr:hypothetical protein [Xylophilus ampelinus]MCS4509526.1 hypothetical protein [Xylophilus ampelinus]